MGYRYDIWRIVVVTAFGIAAGLVSGEMVLWLFLTTLGFLAWHLYNLHHLLHWLREPKHKRIPEFPGVYEMICREIFRLRDRHKKRKKQLSGYLQQFQQATSALPDATVVLGPNDEILWANDAAQDYLGVRWPQDLRQRLTNLVRQPGLAELLRRHATSRQALEIPSPVRPGVHLSVLLVPYGKDQRLFVARDVTRLQQIHQSQNDFIANLSHELRTPLTVLRGYIEVMREREVECPPEWLGSLAQMETQTERMQAIVEDLLLLSRLEARDKPLQAEPVDMPALVRRLRDEAQRLSGPGCHRIDIDVDEGLLLLGEKDKLHSAFGNLVANAVQYTDPGGRIALRWYRDGDGAHFEVRDTGQGIADHHLPRLTERFYRVDGSRARASGGTGLGLAIVAQILKRHNAILHIVSEPDRGSVFRCDFPAVAIALVPVEAV
jgi:two-component system phosphate regulon sensor histidine kinase PhoR